MRCWKRMVKLVLMMGMVWLGGCGGSNTPGRMEWVSPHTTATRVGTVYCLRGWKGVFSPGVDAIAKQVNEAGGTGLVYMPEQYPELAAEIVKKYKGDARHEPIVFVGHSRGVDSSLIIARELEKAGIAVDMIACFDSVDEVTVPKNVKACYNYWMPGIGGTTSNFLRGIPLVQAPGSTGKLYNIDLDGDGSDLKGPLTDHISMDAEPKVQRDVLKHILEVCTERSVWEKQAAR